MPVPYEEPADTEWQTRIGAELDDYQVALAAALEEIFGDGVHDLDGIVTRLNQTVVRTGDGRDWTADSFKAEMKRLGV